MLQSQSILGNLSADPETETTKSKKKPTFRKAIYSIEDNMTKF